MTSSIGEFNKEYFEFLKFIKEHLKEDPNFRMFYRKNKILREANPKFFIRTWYNRIGSKYHKEVMQRDISFFMNKDYENELNEIGESTLLLKYINKFKESYPSLEESVKEQFVSYIVNLTDKSFLYYK